MISRWEVRGALIDLTNTVLRAGVRGENSPEVDQAVTKAADRICAAVEDHIDEALGRGDYADE